MASSTILTHGSQVEYEDYIADTAATGGKQIKTTLAELIRRIEGKEAVTEYVSSLDGLSSEAKRYFP